MPRPFRERQQFGIGAITPRSSRHDRKHTRKSSHQGTANLLSLPAEILLDLVQYLYLPDLEALFITCKRFHHVVHESLSNEQPFAREKLRDITPTSDNYGFHDLLLGILKRGINPNYIKKLDCRQACLSLDPYFGSSEKRDEFEVECYIGWTPEDISLIRATISRSPWLENIATPDEMIHTMLEKDPNRASEDAVLALLMPLLKNLSLFLPPRNAPLLQLVFVKIARAQIVAELTHPQVWQQLPLRRLHTIVANLGIPLTDAIHFMSLPSVRRVFLDQTFDWDGPVHVACANIRSLSGIPRSRAPTVYIRTNAIWCNVAEVFVEYLQGPCILRQFIGDPVPDEMQAQESWVAENFKHNGIVPADPMSYYWDHCTINPGRDEDFAPPTDKNWASQAWKEPHGRTVDFTLKYRAFHDYEYARSDDEYEDTFRQAGVVPSPQWLALVKWNRHRVHPQELDDDIFTLDE